MKGVKIPCIVTGTLTYFSGQILQKKLSKFGSDELFREHYISTPARKLLRKGLTVDEIREQLNIDEKLPKVDLKILSRLGLLKKIGRSRKTNHDREERQKYLNSQEFKDKMKAVKVRYENMTFQEWVEEFTGGTDRIWLREGDCKGTCIRPDVFLSWNDRACDGCPYHEYCLCRNKRLSHEKRRR